MPASLLHAHLHDPIPCMHMLRGLVVRACATHVCHVAAHVDVPCCACDVTGVMRVCMSGWSALSEAISMGDRPILDAVWKRYKQRSTDELKQRAPELLKMFDSMGEYGM